MSVDDLTMTNPNIRRFYDNRFIGKIILDSEHENVLTNIRVVKDQRGKGYSRKILQKWAKWCSEEYDYAYVINIKSGRIESVLERFRMYKTEEVPIQNVPGDIESGPTVPDLTYKIFLEH